LNFRDLEEFSQMFSREKSGEYIWVGVWPHQQNPTLGRI